MIESVVAFISGVSAVSSAVSAWVKYRDSQRAKEQFDRQFQEKQEAPKTTEQAERLSAVVPQKILDKLSDRAKRCWERYAKVLEGDFLPEEIDEATEAVKKCLCREIGRIKSLNGSIPDEDLEKAYEQYECAKVPVKQVT